jgi:hypothetical protein
MPCFYYSLNANASTKLKNVPFMEAELGAHVLRMCPLLWQDQYNMNEGHDANGHALASDFVESN